MNRIKELRLVEIELFNYCNRKCEWCPNSFIDRTNIKKLNWNLFTKLIDELANNEYKGAITFSRYNEPLSNIPLLNKAIIYIKEKMPYCKCVTNTNGDFIVDNTFSNLLIDELTIMDYDNIGAKQAEKKLLQCNAIIDEITSKYIYAHYNNMQILYYLNWEQNRKITDRGGILPQYKGPIRKRPCFEPKYFIGINYDGSVSPCCNIRNDCNQTSSYILGDLFTESLSDILKSEKSLSFTQSCEQGNFKDLICCKTCDNIGGRYTRGKGGISYE